MLAILALLAFLPPAFAPQARTISEAPGFPLIICTADGLVLLTPETGDEPAEEPPSHDLSCLACLLRLASPPPALAVVAEPAAPSRTPVLAWVVADAVPQVRPHLRPDKTGPPRRV